MTALEAAYQHCADIAKSHYENFPVGSSLIPEKKRKHVWAVYAFARTADDFADEGRHPKETFQDLQVRLDQLNNWEVKLMRASRGEADEPIFIALANTLKETGLPAQLFRDLLTAYRMDVEKKRYANFTEILHYCRHSANPIGRLVLLISGYKDEGLHQMSDHICTALQMANFWQDVGVDFEKDRIYLPQELMKRYGVTEGDLALKIVNKAFRTLLSACVEKAADLFNQGLPLCQGVKKDLRMEIRLTWLGGTQILHKIQSSNYDVFKRRPVIGKKDIFVLLLRALLPLPLKPYEFKRG